MKESNFMSLQELETDLRSHGVKTSKVKLKAFILHDKYPFAIGDDSKGDFKYEIYRKLYEEWKRKVFY